MTLRPRRALVLTTNRGPTFRADVHLDAAWAHLSRVEERHGAFGEFWYSPRDDRTLRAGRVAEIRWIAA
jgi:hypothetical protein